MPHMVHFVVESMYNAFEQVSLIYKKNILSIIKLLGHKIAHIKEREHNKAFYQLCQHMEPDYHQLEFDLRAYLTYLEAAGQPLWSAADSDTVTSLKE